MKCKDESSSKWMMGWNWLPPWIDLQYRKNDLRQSISMDEINYGGSICPPSIGWIPCMHFFKLQSHEFLMMQNDSLG